MTPGGTLSFRNTPVEAPGCRLLNRIGSAGLRIVAWPEPASVRSVIESIVIDCAGSGPVVVDRQQDIDLRLPRLLREVLVARIVRLGRGPPRLRGVPARARQSPSSSRLIVTAHCDAGMHCTRGKGQLLKKSGR